MPEFSSPVCLLREIIKCPLHSSGKERACIMRSFAATKTYNWQSSKTDLFRQINWSSVRHWEFRLSRNFSFLLERSDQTRETSWVRKPWQFPCYLCYNWYFLRPKYAKKNAIYTMIWRHVCMLLYLQLSCMAESKTVTEILKFTSLFGKCRESKL